MNKLFRFFLLVVSAAVLHGYAPGAQATPFICAAPYVLSLAPPAPAQINPNAAIGATLWSASIYAQTNGGATCTGPFPSPATIDFLGSMPYEGNYIYDTGIPGIGYTLTFSSAVNCGMTNWPATCTMNWAQGVSAHSILVKLVKTGPIGAGGSLQGEFAHWDLHQNAGESGGNQKYVVYNWSAPLIITPTNPACTVDTPSKSISVTLPDTPGSAFGGIGTTAGTPQNFNISLTCSGGDPGTSTNVWITLTDATNPANVTDMLSPTAATAGTGVGIRIYKGATPVKYGADSSTVGNTNQWQVTNVGPGTNTVTIPLTATYVQVGSTVQGGIVNAIATFTMAYN